MQSGFYPRSGCAGPDAGRSGSSAPGASPRPRRWRRRRWGRCPPRTRTHATRCFPPQTVVQIAAQAPADVGEVCCSEDALDGSTRYRQPPDSAPDFTGRVSACAHLPSFDPGSQLNLIQLVVSGRAERSLQGAHALHVARMPRGRELRGPRLGLHRESSRLVAVPDQLRQRTFWTALLLALAAPMGARAQSPVAAPPGVPPPPPAEARAAVALPRPRRSPSARTTRASRSCRCRREADRDAWARSGFRLGLGLSYGHLVGLQGAPSGRLLGACCGSGFVSIADWSLMASLQYAPRVDRGRARRAALLRDDRSDLARDAAPVARGRPRLRRHRRGEHQPPRGRARCRATLATLVHLPERGSAAAELQRRRRGGARARRVDHGARSALGDQLRARGDRSVDRLRRRHGHGRSRHRAGDRAPPVVAARRRDGGLGDARGVSARRAAGRRRCWRHCAGASRNRRCRRWRARRRRRRRADAGAAPTRVRRGDAAPTGDAAPSFEPPRALTDTDVPVPRRTRRR